MVQFSENRLVSQEFVKNLSGTFCKFRTGMEEMVSILHIVDRAQSICVVLRVLVLVLVPGRAGSAFECTKCSCREKMK